MSLGVLQSLFQMLEEGAGRNPVTPAPDARVTLEPAPSLARTRVTHVTPAVRRPAAHEAHEAHEAQSCAACRHRSRANTCRRPVEAGLLTKTEGFGIVWPPENYGAACPAWSSSPAQAIVAVLTAAGRGGWPDALMHQWLQDAEQHPEAVLDELRRGRKLANVTSSLPRIGAGAGGY
jgi:hypothetical protein